MPVGEPALPCQLALALGHGESFERDDFLPASGNAAALALIDRWPDWPARLIALSGPEGAGKSHLAAIWARAAGARQVRAGAIGNGGVPQALSTGALVVEDASSASDEAALFHLLNLANEQRAYVLLVARDPPVRWPIALPDLVSRLRVIPTVALAPPDDALLRSILVKLFADRQLSVDDALIGYLLTRIERTCAAARAVVADLDETALRLKRPVSRALAAEILRQARALTLPGGSDLMS
jgi:chromosomal replication initiation ATPase DnaA